MLTTPRHPPTPITRRLVAAAAMIALSGPAAALSLSEINLFSQLNQPLQARIELGGFNPVEADQMAVQIADEDMQARYNGSQYLSVPITAKLVSNEQGGYIELSSERTVSEPFMMFAVQVDSPQGTIMRQYELLIDPPAHAGQPEARQAAHGGAGPHSGASAFSVSAAERAGGIEPVAAAAPSWGAAPVQRAAALSAAPRDVRTAEPRPFANYGAQLFDHPGADATAHALLSYRANVRRGLRTDLSGREIVELAARNVRRVLLR